MPELDETNSDYPFGYGFCQCGCGKQTRLAAGIRLRYFHPSHNPRWKAARRVDAAAKRRRIDVFTERQGELFGARVGESRKASDESSISTASSARELELKKKIAETRSVMRRFRRRRSRVAAFGARFQGERRPKNITKQSPLLRSPVRPEVWDALIRNQGLQDRLLPEVIQAIKQRSVSLREVSRFLGTPSHVSGQWYRRQLLQELRSRLTPAQQADPEAAFRRSEISLEEMQLLLDAKLKSLKSALWICANKERHQKRLSAYNVKRFHDDPDFRERRLAASAKWRKLNKEKFNASRQKWLDHDLSARLADRLRSRIRSALRSQSARKVSRLDELIGCRIEDLRGHLADKFQPGMSWENYGEWHVDHIVPCAAFDLTQPEGQRKCFHYSNLQPLWEKENIRKGKKCPK